MGYTLVAIIILHAAINTWKFLKNVNEMIVC